MVIDPVLAGSACCIGTQCGRQEAWTTVDLALIRGLVLMRDRIRPGVAALGVSVLEAV